MKTIQTGDVIDGKYEVTRILGQGGMGVVVAARDRRLDRVVAIKFRLHESPDAAARFDREAKTIAQITNDHVAPVYDVGRVDGSAFMVMELLVGEDLAATLRVRGALPLAEAADLVLQACEGVHAAHALGIVHRDLKPANLFLTTRPDGTPLVKVVDFGIAKSGAAEDVSVTGSSDLVGSPAYMSPEQLASAREVDARADVWALGVIVYELLAAARPFPGETFPEVYTAILRGTYDALSTRRPDAPPELDALLADALAQERDARIGTVEAFASRLATFGTDAARASYERIRRAAARAGRASDAPPLALVPNVTAAAHVSAVTPPRASVDAPGRRRWGAWGAAAAAIGGAVFLLVRVHESATGATAASASAAPSGSATPPPPDPKEMAREAQADCDRGALAACNQLGAFYALGKGVPRDGAKAVQVYKSACERGFATACMNLGGMLFDGDGVAQDEALGASYFLRACQGGEARGCVNVSVAYAKGRGVTKDAGQAVFYAEKACEGNARRGCVRVAAAKVRGDGVATDVKGGLAELAAQCAAREPSGCAELAALYGGAAADAVRADPLRARDYAKQACDLGDTRSCDALRVVGQADSVGVAGAQGHAGFEASCAKGNLVACDLAGEDLIAGWGVHVDRARGLALIGRACKGGVARGCARMVEAGVR